MNIDRPTDLSGRKACERVEVERSRTMYGAPIKK